MHYLLRIAVDRSPSDCHPVTVDRHILFAVAISVKTVDKDYSVRNPHIWYAHCGVALRYAVKFPVNEHTLRERRGNHRKWVTMLDAFFGRFAQFVSSPVLILYLYRMHDRNPDITLVEVCYIDINARCQSHIWITGKIRIESADYR